MAPVWLARAAISAVAAMSLCMRAVSRSSCSCSSCAQAFAREQRALGEGILGQSARPHHDRAQRLAVLDGVHAREPHFADHDHLVLLGPARDLLDGKLVEGPKLDVGRRLALRHRSEVDADDLGATLLAVVDRVAGQLGAAAVSRGVEAAARADQVGHVHAAFERVVAGNLDLAVDVDDLGRLLQVGLQRQLLHQRLDHAVPAGLQVEDGQRIARLQQYVGRRSREP